MIPWIAASVLGWAAAVFFWDRASHWKGQAEAFLDGSRSCQSIGDVLSLDLSDRARAALAHLRTEEGAAS